MMLSDEGILTRSDAFWEVISTPPVPDVNRQADSPFKSDPDMILVERCGSNLSRVLQGKLDPLQLLFPEGDSTTIGQFYRDFRY
ncbi:MAG: hypothetical protein A4E57_03140 [Syntrophorhabdaceae bacterium PtaU1.Bin034]|jgi:hypothetical protein|nr:MAG: hypothetical protein A4E57_03140 [Syntrophorhabdaceae bacterium PtaU1.Bin034]